MYGILASLGLLVTGAAALGDYDPDWIQKTRLSLFQINNIFNYITIDPTAPDRSADLYKQLVAYDTFQDFAAIPGFGFAFQDQINQLADNVYSPVQQIQQNLDFFVSNRIDQKIAGAISNDFNCTNNYYRSVDVIRTTFAAVNKLI